MANSDLTTTSDDTEKLRCFVIGPIGNRLAEFGSEERQAFEEALEVFSEVIEPACVELGLAKPVRSDGLARAGEITEQIFRRLRDDDIVIADLTGANPNVMYELGLRHARGGLTVQIGEYGRLPFDVSVIRTVMFSRSPQGLINARKELRQILAAGLAGEYDPVSATRIWSEDESEDHRAVESAADEFEEPAGFVDILADAESRQDDLITSTEEISAEISALGSLAEGATEELHASDARGGGMRGRLAVIARFAAGVGEIAGRLEEAVDRYSEALGAVSAGMDALVTRMEESDEDLADGMKFGMTTRTLAATSRASLAGLAGFVESLQESAKVSRVVRGPSRRVTDALRRFADDTQTLDELDRRLQTLGVPLLPDDHSSPGDVAN